MEKILISAGPINEATPAFASIPAVTPPQRIVLQPVLPENGCMINGIPATARNVLALTEADTVIADVDGKSIHFNFLKFPTESGRYRIVHSGPYQAGEVNVLSGLYSSREEQHVYATVTISAARCSQC